MPTGFAVSLGKMNWIALKHWKKSTIEVQSLATLANTEKNAWPKNETGTQKGVALSLGVDWRTIQRREAGDVAVSREAWIALCALPLRKMQF